MCGENITSLISPKKSLGSPPRVRGKLRNDKPVYAEIGITPACAGKTIRRLGLFPDKLDHPRVCGENFMRMTILFPAVGSPPRVRGKRASGCHAHETRGITPACAGKTRRSACGGVLREDHPRVCGENLGVSAQPHLNSGSPPRVRGKRG